MSEFGAIESLELFCECSYSFMVIVTLGLLDEIGKTVAFDGEELGC